MKYKTEDALKEIRRRAKKIKQKNEKKIINTLTTTISFTLIALFSTIRFFSGSEIYLTPTEYGSFIISAETSEYVLIAVIGLILGSIIAFVINDLKNNK